MKESRLKPMISQHFSKKFVQHVWDVVNRTRRRAWPMFVTGLALLTCTLSFATSSAAREPDVRECQERAAALLGTDDVSVTRLRRANMLPDRVSVDGGLTSDRDRRNETTWTEDAIAGELLGDGTMRELLRGDNGVRWQAGLRVEWRLTGLVYDDDELALARESERLQQERVEAMHEVATAWYGRQQALFDARRASELGRPADVEAALLEAGHYAAILDAWTAGWFTEVLEEAPAGSVDSPGGPD